MQDFRIHRMVLGLDSKARVGGGAPCGDSRVLGLRLGGVNICRHHQPHDPYMYIYML